ncbi:MAG: sigma-70 family RNA polymerase sigma factor [Duncaniella sp.]|nr:sigma-70 family RNA polymerase sigma factor [Muribaculum sp.]MCM1255684.1 sigma-70 family RNA polymerase sigma factor [Duncaniella sp.]
MRPSILSSTFIQLRDKLHSIAVGIVGNSDDADDVIQESFCRLWSHQSEIQDEVSAMRLSYTAVRNTAIDTIRRSKSHPSVTIDSVTDRDEYDREAEEDLEREYTYNAVVRLARKVLKESHFEVFRLHDIEGFSYPEVAEQLGLTQENVRVTLSRVRKTIRETYRKQQSEI